MNRPADLPPVAVPGPAESTKWVCVWDGATAPPEIVDPACPRCGRRMKMAALPLSAAVSGPASEPQNVTEGMPPELVRALRDPTIRVPMDDCKLADGRSLWDHLQEWRNAPSNTAPGGPGPASVSPAEPPARELGEYEKGYLDGVLAYSYRSDGEVYVGRNRLRTYRSAALGFLRSRGFDTKGWKVDAR